MGPLLHIWEVSTSLFVLTLAGLAVGYATGTALVMAPAVAVGISAVALVGLWREWDASLNLTILAGLFAAIAVALRLFGDVMPPVNMFATGALLFPLTIAFMTAVAAQKEGAGEHSGLLFFTALPLGLGTVLGGAVLVALFITRWQAVKHLHPVGAQHV